jgi:hypothetical protein
MKRVVNQRSKQMTSEELTEACLTFLKRKFYSTETVAFAQDREKLLEWVVLWPASWLDEREITIPVERYREIFMKVMMDAVVHGNERIKYRPAWLRQVIQSHFDIHGEEIYNAAKNVRTIAESILLSAGRAAVPQAVDPIRQMAQARAILLAAKSQAKTKPVKEQLNLF